MGNAVKAPTVIDWIGKQELVEWDGEFTVNTLDDNVDETVDFKKWPPAGYGDSSKIMG